MKWEGGRKRERGGGGRITMVPIIERSKTEREKR